MIFTKWGRQGNWGGTSWTNPLPRVFPSVKSKMAETVRPYLRFHRQEDHENKVALFTVPHSILSRYIFSKTKHPITIFYETKRERDNTGYIDSFNYKEYIGSSCCPGLFWFCGY